MVTRAKANNGKGGKMTSEQATTWIWTQASDLSKEAIRRYMRNPYQKLYATYGPGTVALSSEEDRLLEGVALVAAEHLPRHLDQTQLTRWLVDRLKSCPCLPAAGA